MRINELLKKEGNLYIWELYKQLLNRPPQKDELIHNQIQLHQGITKKTQIIGIINSLQAAYLYQTPQVSPVRNHSTIADIIRTFYSLPTPDFIHHAFSHIVNSPPTIDHQPLIQNVTQGKITRQSFIANLIEALLQPSGIVAMDQGTPEENLNQRILQIDRLVSPIDGWLTTKEGSSLYKLARFDAPNSTIVEVGSFKGRSTSWLSFAINDRGGGKVYAVDHWKDWGEISGVELFQTFINNLNSLNLLSFVQPIQSDTIDAANNWPLHNEIGLLFIDAVHDYHSVRRDFEFWSPKVIEGGYIAFHDVDTWTGPTKLVQELPRWIKKIEQVDSVWIGQKLC